MLATDPKDVIARLTDAYADIVALDNFALSCQGVQVGRIADEPEWFTRVAIEFRRLDAAADVWQLDRPLVWLPVLQAFRDYCAMFLASSRLFDQGSTDDARLWVELFEVRLLPDVVNGLAATRAADKELRGMIRAFGSPQPQMAAALAAGLEALVGERQHAFKPSTRLAHLTSALGTMGGLQAQYLTLRGTLSRLVAFWEQQQASLVQLLTALKAGAQPSNLPGLKALPGELAAWQVIDAFVAHLSKLDITVGAPAIIDIGGLRPSTPALPDI
ncbi:hypothetical protein [Pseudomonas sp. NPDC089401]|uniref:hypothetical protein n=1 Tax=Pseudomonas sp. NPDC089401 TaxID=3364462 RepID=UPI003802E737